MKDQTHTALEVVEHWPRRICIRFGNEDVDTRPSYRGVEHFKLL